MVVHSRVNKNIKISLCNLMASVSHPFQYTQLRLMLFVIVSISIVGKEAKAIALLYFFVREMTVGTNDQNAMRGWRDRYQSEKNCR